jgi:hypothetical protein
MDPFTSHETLPHNTVLLLIKFPTPAFWRGKKQSGHIRKGSNDNIFLQIVFTISSDKQLL